MTFVSLAKYHVKENYFNHRSCTIDSPIHHDSAQEVYNFCEKHQLSDTWTYLYHIWYAVNMWKLWARSVVEHIPNSTVMIESHWRVLRRNHLYLNNRSRLDYLVYVIIQKQCTDLLYDYEQKVVFRRDIYQCERDFQKEWRKHLAQEGKVN